MMKLLQPGHALASVEALRKHGLHRNVFPVLEAIFDETRSSPVRQRFIQLALADTDRRVAEDRAVAPSFLLACLLWHDALARWQELQRRGEHPIPALQQAIDAVFDARIGDVSGRGRLASDMREIWLMQPRFERRQGGCRRNPWWRSHSSVRATISCVCAPTRREVRCRRRRLVGGLRARRRRRARGTAAGLARDSDRTRRTSEGSTEPPPRNANVGDGARALGRGRRQSIRATARRLPSPSREPRARSSESRLRAERNRRPKSVTWIPRPEPLCGRGCESGRRMRASPAWHRGAARAAANGVGATLVAVSHGAGRRHRPGLRERRGRASHPACTVELLQALHSIEEQQGRWRSTRNAPRTLDLDLLLYGQWQCRAPTLTLPHPRLHTRAFVLRPLLEIAPHITAPGLGPLAAWLDAVAGQASRRWPCTARNRCAVAARRLRPPLRPSFELPLEEALAADRPRVPISTAGAQQQRRRCTPSTGTQPVAAPALPRVVARVPFVVRRQAVDDGA